MKIVAVLGSNFSDIGEGRLSKRIAIPVEFCGCTLPRSAEPKGTCPLPLLFDFPFSKVSEEALNLSGLLELLEELDATLESAFSEWGYETCPERRPLIFTCDLRRSNFAWEFEAGWVGETFPALRLFRADAEKAERGGRAGEVVHLASLAFDVDSSFE